MRMRLGAVAGLLLTLVLVALPARPAEPFYVNLLESGTRDYLRSDYAEAVKKLRTACFGLLEEPRLLAEGLIRLALAQAGDGDDDGFRATFDRLVEVEKAFAAYSDLPPMTPFKSDFERELPRKLSAADLATAPAFAGALAQLREAKLAALPPKRLRRELERRLEADPNDSEALVLLTRLEISENRPQKAERRLEELLSADPENRTARCVRGQMRLRGDNCSGSMEDLPYCSAPPVDAVLGARYLRCLVTASDWRAAGEYLALLPLEVRALEAVTELALTIPSAALEDLARPATRTPELGAGTVEDPSAEPASSPPPPDPVAADRARAAQIRQMTGTAGSREELAALLSEAAALAERQPDSREIQFLAAEIAYRRGDWDETVRFFRRGGEPDADRPLQRFYLAVALFETGEKEEAARLLEAALPRLEPTAFVERYRDLILRSSPTETPPIPVDGPAAGP